MRQVARVAFVVALTTIAVLGGVFGTTRASAQASAESDFIGRINAERTSRGLGALSVDGELTGIARNWSSHMESTATLSHNGNFSKQVRQNWSKLGENVGVGSTVGDIHDAFMNSAAHKANILDSAFTRVGVGVVTGGDGSIWVTENFMRLQSDDNAGGGGGGGTTAPPPTAAPTTRPPTTRPPATTPVSRPPTTPKPATTAPPPTEPPVTEPEPTTAPPPPPEAPYRLKLVLNGLQILDGRVP